MPTSALRKHRGERKGNGAAAPYPTPDKLIEAAGPVFAARGYQAATVREICARAGANVAAVNYHFRDKLGLYAAVLKESVQASKFDEIADLFQRDAAPEEMLRSVIESRLRAARRAHLVDWHFLIMLHEMAQPTPAFTRVIHEVIRPIYERMLKLTGAILGLSPHAEKVRLCTHSVVGQMMFYTLQAPLLARLWPDLKMTPEQTDRIAAHIADFSLAYLRAASVKSGAKPGDSDGKPQDN